MKRIVPRLSERSRGLMPSAVEAVGGDVLDFARTASSTSLGKAGSIFRTGLAKSLTVLGAATLSLAAAAPNWTATITQAPNAAFVMGNPKAKVRFVEYLSYTCSHCAAFVGEASAPLKKNYVAKGLVAIEVRNAVRDRYDFTAALLARCGGPAKFFGNTELLMANQGKWLGAAPAFDAANAEKMSKLPITDSLKLIARGTGLDALMKARGISPAQMDACLADKAAQQKIVAMTNEAWNDRKINGTPAFLVNGSTVEGAGHWTIVEPALTAALAAK